MTTATSVLLLSLLLTLILYATTTTTTTTTTQNTRGSRSSSSSHTTVTTPATASLSHAYIETHIWTSELSNEIDSLREAALDVDEWFVRHLNGAWDYARYMEEEDEQDSSSKYVTLATNAATTTVAATVAALGQVMPFLVCLNHANYSGYTRKLLLKEYLLHNNNNNNNNTSTNRVAASAEVMMETVSNTRDSTCFRVPLTASIAMQVQNHEDVMLVPISPVMKLRDVTLDKLHSVLAEHKTAVKLSAQLGHWINPDRTDGGYEVVHHIADYIVEHMSHSCHANMNTDEHGHDHDHSVRSLHTLFTIDTADSDTTAADIDNGSKNGKRSSSARHNMWRESFQRGLEESNTKEPHCCADLFEGLWHTIDTDTNSVTYILASQPHTNSPTETTEACVLSFLAALSLDKDVISVTALDDVTTLNANAQWIVSLFIACLSFLMN